MCLAFGKHGYTLGVLAHALDTTKVNLIFAGKDASPSGISLAELATDGIMAMKRLGLHSLVLC